MHLMEMINGFSHPSSVNRWSSPVWNQVGRAIHSPEWDMLPSLLNQYYTGYHRHPLSELGLRDSVDGVAKSTIGKDGFEVAMDVQQFAPNEISVKIVGNTIVVEANHEERKDEHGYISRQFKRRFTLPQGFNVKDVLTQLSSDGVLTVKVPPEIKAVDQGNVRVLQIQQTGPARLNSGNKEVTKQNDGVHHVKK